MAWRLARSLEKLRAQVNAEAPTRSKASDGTIGDAAHASRASDHNPYIKDGSIGVVRALDLTHDPAGGLDSYALAETLRASGDKRITYIISNGKIANSGQPWRRYDGKNSHSQHVHISVSEAKALYDDERDWQIGIIAHKPSIADPMPKPVIERPFLLKGSRGDAVAFLQGLLGIVDDGIFGPNTESAVKAFQRAKGLVADGLVGAYTWSALLNK